MVKSRTLYLPGFQKTAGHRFLPLLLALFSLIAISARAALQFDVFLGYDGVVPEASWFPVVCEVKNDGPTFMGTIEVSSGRFGEGQVRRIVVELPTGTLKRLVIPVFSTQRYQASWDVRLLDDRGHMRAEQADVRPRRQTAAETTLLGAIPRTATGLPTFRPIHASDAEMQPVAARLQTSIMPDNPLVLEGMDTFYLNSERAADLTELQVAALLSWLNAGGHLIIGVESISDVNGTPWLRRLVPCDLTDMRTVTNHPELRSWLRGPGYATGGPSDRSGIFIRGMNPSFNPYADAVEDPDFENAGLQVAVGTLRSGGEALASSSGAPLMLSSHEGSGLVTTLMFSPERKPFNDWKNLPSFWAKLCEVSTDLYRDENNVNAMRGGWSIDGVFGAMIDSKQVRKLPVEWLLLLLIAYLVVIGPLDQYWLKRIRRPMLTWITFPCYVVMFSLLIYFIGYKLRAGETEWNELHLVDVLMNGDGAELRGRTYASIYSPINGTYRVEAPEHFATFRGEFQSTWSGGGADGERAEVWQTGDNFKADIFVPVWTSQLYASDWWQAADLPLKATVARDGSDWAVIVSNYRDHPLNNIRLAIDDRMLDLGELAAGQTKTYKFPRDEAPMLRDFVQSRAGGFQQTIQSRQQAFGGSGAGRISDLPGSCTAVSFISNLPQERFITPPGLDMTVQLERGNAVLLAWEPDYSPIASLNQFPTRRSNKNTLWRVSIPVNAALAP